MGLQTETSTDVARVPMKKLMFELVYTLISVVHWMSVSNFMLPNLHRSLSSGNAISKFGRFLFFCIGSLRNYRRDIKERKTLSSKSYIAHSRFNVSRKKKQPNNLRTILRTSRVLTSSTAYAAYSRSQTSPNTCQPKIGACSFSLKVIRLQCHV